MLTGLRLENIALIERLELSFGTGFHVLTGETGAGKSLLLDALDALLGGAQGGQAARLLRRGSDRGRIEAGFSLSPPVRAWLRDQELDSDDDELLISREWRLAEGAVSAPALPTLHPAFLLRQPIAKRDVWADLLSLASRIEP